ncbi:MAG: radical SAM protein [Defluviitaleaceae bacterium]|nr:radical SAM protein [Defluviitaleaceae bacterium]
MQQPNELLKHYEEIKQAGRMEAAAELQAILKAKDFEINLLKNMLADFNTTQKLPPVFNENQTTKPKIFFGMDDYTKTNVKKWSKTLGEPVIWCVRDKFLHHHINKKYLGKYEVTSLDNAINRFPDAEIHLAYTDITTAINVANQIVKKFAKKISPKNIHFLAAEVEYRKSCSATGKSLAYEKERVGTCTTTLVKRPFSNIQEHSAHEVVDIWNDLVTDLINNQRQGNPLPCDKCTLYKQGFYSKNADLSTVYFLQSLPKDTCNFNCIYCAPTNNKVWRKLRDAEGATTNDVIKQFAKIPQLANNEKFTIHLANGEPLANRHANEIFSTILNTKWQLEIVSNSGIYNENFANLMEMGRVKFFNTSLDAGTKETFLKIKRVDRFDKVLENLRRLPLQKTNFMLKYVFLEGINDNETDIKAFYEICKELNVHIRFSANSRLQEDRLYTDKMRTLIADVVAWAKKDGLKVSVPEDRVHPKDVAWLALLKNMMSDKTSGGGQFENLNATQIAVNRKIILLNGVSSAGKTTLARALQKKLDEPFFKIGPDWLFSAAPQKYSKGHTDTRSVFRKGLYIVPNIAQVFAGNGMNLIIDQVLIKNTISDFLLLLQDYDVLFVQVVCPLDELRRREKDRGNRKIGLAESQLSTLYPQDPTAYDITVDTFTETTEVCADKIIALLAQPEKCVAFRNLCDRRNEL